MITHTKAPLKRTQGRTKLLVLQMLDGVKAWPNARNMSTQHLVTLLHDVATCVARGGQTFATFSSFSTQHVNVHVPQAPGAHEVNLTRMPLRATMLRERGQTSTTSCNIQNVARKI